MVGTTISHYRILSKLGEGGMGVVYLAEDLNLQRTVALKFLPSDSVSPTERERFLREARAAALIRHPNVCPIYEIEEADDRLFFAMAHIKGPTIRQLLETGPLRVERALDLAVQIASGLAAAHQQGVVHRDIKSGNVVVDEHGVAIILDFGLAMSAESARITKAGNRVGTPAYMSPEQIQSHEVDHRSDLWSLGVLLYEMLAGRLPFPEDGGFNVLFSIVKDEPPRLSSLRPEVAKDLEAVVNRALAKDPGQRWQNAGQMSAALRVLRSTLPDLDATVPIPQHLPLPARGRRWLLPAMALLGAVLAALAWQLWPARSLLPTQKQVAVLPFHVVGKEEALQTMTDGLVETVTSKLSQLEQFEGEFMVVPASEVRSRKITTAAEARRIYGANLVISGSAQRIQKRIQLTLNLIDTNSMRQVGTRTLEFDAAQPIALRDGSVSGIVRLLELRLSKPASTAVRAGETFAPNAYNEYLKGRGYLARMDVSGNLTKAIASLELSIGHDPNYALAYAALAEAYWFRSTNDSDRRWADKALETAMRAVSLDPALVIAHVRYGEMLVRTGKSEEGLKELLRARSLAPRNADVSMSLANFYSAAGRDGEAESAYKTAVTQRPTNWYGHLMLGLFYAQRGRLDDARVSYEQAIKLTPENQMILRNLATLYLRQGQYLRAVDHFQRILRLEQTATSYAGLGLANYYLHQYDKAAAAFESAIDLTPDSYTLWGNLATVYRRMPSGQEKGKVAFLRAATLARQALDITPNDYRVKANLSEYLAKLGQRRESLAMLDAIPGSARRPYMSQIALVYEVLGERAKAIQTVQTLVVDRRTLSTLRDDPDLEGLWNDPDFQNVVAALPVAGN